MTAGDYDYLEVPVAKSSVATCSWMCLSAGNIRRAGATWDNVIIVCDTTLLNQPMYQIFNTFEPLPVVIWKLELIGRCPRERTCSLTWRSR